MIKKYRKIIIIVVILGGLLLFNKMFIQTKANLLNNATSYLLKPLSTAFAKPAWWIKDKTSFFVSIGNLKKENQKLFDNNLKLQAEIARLKNISTQNEILRQQLKLAPQDKYNLEPALIIGRSSSNDSEIIYLDKGLKDGLNRDAAVLVGEGVLIGKIIDITDNTSKVQLIIDNNFKVNAKLLESGGKGIVEGQFGTSAVMKMIPQTVEVKKGDTIITSELSEKIRGGLLIGYVQDVSTTSDQLFQEASVFFPINFDKLYLVWVLK